MVFFYANCFMWYFMQIAPRFLLLDYEVIWAANPHILYMRDTFKSYHIQTDTHSNQIKL